MSDTHERHWTQDEMRTWSAHGDDPNETTVHMFPCGVHAGYPSACGAVLQREGVSEGSGEAAPLEDWGNGNDQNTLCTACLGAWWKGPRYVHWERPTHPVVRRFTDVWVYPGDRSTVIHLQRNDVYAACSVELHTRIVAPMFEVIEDYRIRKVEIPEVCHPCAVIWDAQCARDAGMDASEGRGWGWAAEPGDLLHRFWHLDVLGLDTHVELTYCTPHLAARLGATRSTLDECVDPVEPVCPACLVAESSPLVPVTQTEAEAEVPEPNGPPEDLWGCGVGGSYHWIPSLATHAYVSSNDSFMKHAPACAPTRRFVQTPLHPLEQVQCQGAAICDPCGGLWREAQEAYRATVAGKAQAVRQAAQKAVQERESPVARELLDWVNELLARLYREGQSVGRYQSSEGFKPYNPSNIFTVHVSSYVANFLHRFREDIAVDLEGVARECEEMGALMDADGNDGTPDRRRAIAYRDAARRVREWPTLKDTP